VLTAERDLYNAQSEQVNRHRDSYLALISVYAAMGGGWMVEQDKLRNTVLPVAQTTAPHTSTASKPNSETGTPGAAPAKTQSPTANSQEHAQ
jgi:hypothetical protein